MCVSLTRAPVCVWLTRAPVCVWLTRAPVCVWLTRGPVSLLPQILPAVVNFQPDLILVSAGFDAHRKEELNLRYVRVNEADYEWVTNQIVEVANR